MWEILRSRIVSSLRYFFPPNADPYYHEVSNASVGYLNDLYGPAMAAEFDRQGIPYFTSATFDLFYAVRRTPFWSHLYTQKDDHFAKTGSGQT